MIPRVTPKLPAYAALAALGMMIGLVLGQPAVVILAAPFLLALVVGLALAQQPDFVFSIDVPRNRVMEGDDIDVEIGVTAKTAIETLEVLLVPPLGISTEPEAPVRDIRLVTDESATLHIPAHCLHWGGYQLGNIYLRAQDRLGFFRFEAHLDAGHPVRVYPRPEALRSIPRPAETQVFAGNERSREKGEGIEFIDVRGFVPGDQVRRINWRLSARRGDLIVNEFHRERNADVVLLLDTFAEVRDGKNGTNLMAVRGAVSLAERYLQERNRVGVVGFGGILRWLQPAMGARQRYRIVEALIDTDIVLSYAWKGVDIIPRSTLPPKALVIAFTPLLDERAIDALLDLRARGFDLAIIEVSPVPFVTPDASETGQLAFKIWQMEREALRYRFQCLGVPVVIWEIGQPFEQVLREVQGFRRYTRQARA